MNTTEVLLLSQVRAMAKAGDAQAVREGRGLSRAEVAEVVGVSESTIFRWEAGDRSPKGDAAIRYGRFLQALEQTPT